MALLHRLQEEILQTVQKRDQAQTELAVVKSCLYDAAPA